VEAAFGAFQLGKQRSSVYLFDVVDEAFQDLVGVDQAGDGLTQVTIAVVRQFTEFAIG